MLTCVGAALILNRTPESLDSLRRDSMLIALSNEVEPFVHSRATPQFEPHA